MLDRLKYYGYGVLLMPITFGASLVSVIANYDQDEINVIKEEEAVKLYKIKKMNRRKFGDYFVDSDNETNRMIDKKIARWFKPENLSKYCVGLYE